MTFKPYVNCYLKKCLENNFHALHVHVSEMKYLTGTNTFKHAEFKSKEFPLHRPVVFSIHSNGCVKCSGCVSGLKNHSLHEMEMYYITPC